jgi:hypothetical protein
MPAPLNQSLFDFANRNLDFKVGGMQPPHLIHALENRLQPFKIRGLLDLLIQRLQFVQRIDAVGAHDAIVHHARSRRNIGQALVGSSN